MRVVIDEFELQPAEAEAGWSVTGQALQYTTGIGSAVALTQNSTQTSEYTRSVPSLRELYWKQHIQIGQDSSEQNLMLWLDSALEEMAQIIKINNTTTLGFRVATSGAPLVSGAALNLGQNYLMETFYRPRNSGGRVEIRIDGTLYAEFDGDTNLQSEDFVSYCRFELSRDLVVDNITIDVPSISYDGGVGGAPAVGETVTGATSGTTAVISHVIGDATSGRLHLTEVSGAFTNNEQITTGGTFDALLNAPTSDYVDGLEPLSSWAGNEYIVLGSPNGNGANSGLTGSDGNQVDNYLLVQDNPPNTATYVENTTAGALKDTYQWDASNVPAAVDVSKITCMAVVANVQSDLTGIDNARMLIRQGGTDYQSDQVPLPLSAAVRAEVFATQPDGSGEFTRADVVATEIGIQLEP